MEDRGHAPTYVRVHRLLYLQISQPSRSVLDWKMLVVIRPLLVPANACAFWVALEACSERRYEVRNKSKPRHRRGAFKRLVNGKLVGILRTRCHVQSSWSK